MWDLELVLSTDRLNQKLDLMRADFPRLDLVKHSRTRYFCVFACEMPQPLSEHEKSVLEQWMEQGLLYRFRCGKQKEGGF